jgi:D-beta-D-heptose 7-phosphate kinase/D-beta-D-heptose 1-phosphate adenosyltransferase
VTLNIPEFSKANVLVVGDVMLDRYVFGMSSRISPEAPVPVVLEEKTEERPGGAANVALNLASLGVKTTLVGIVGIDEAGKKVESMLENSSISCDLERDKEWVTITKTRIQSRGQQLLRIDRETYPNANNS